ncbi:hypothetical protein DFH28DRAFT_1035313 [Melampsora americana]|nr:hypothetical protein DFH28DRAFT_1035313 [Melampsora americana]
MSSFESECMASFVDRDDDLSFGSYELPMPSFLINDPDADSYTSYILEEPVTSMDESDDVGCDLADSEYFTTPMQSPCSLAPTSISRQDYNSSTNPVSITLQRLIDRQSQLISNAFESWRRKFPINSCLNSHADLSRLPQPCSQQKSRQPSQTLYEDGDKKFNGSMPSRSVRSESPSNDQESETR